jgi:DNA-binding CsgD family transcriptional regulator
MNHFVTHKEGYKEGYKKGHKVNHSVSDTGNRKVDNHKVDLANAKVIELPVQHPQPHALTPPLASFIRAGFFTPAPALELRPESSEAEPSFDLSPDSSKISHTQLLQAIMEGFMDGYLIVNQQGEILIANSRGRRFCQALAQMNPQQGSQKGAMFDLKTLPQEIWRVCQALIDNPDLEVGANLVPESEILLNNQITLRIRVNWLDPTTTHGEQPGSGLLVVTLEDRQQSRMNLAIADAQKYDLTPRETEIWQMRLQGMSYQRIAEVLFITPNTVKKHVKNILAKRRTEW